MTTTWLTSYSASNTQADIYCESLHVR